MKKLAKISVILYFLPLVALGASTVTQLPTTQVTNLGTLGDKICLVGAWMFNILIFVAIIFAIYAAFLYLTAQGEPEKIQKANHTLIYIAVAIVVAVLARSVPGIIFDFTQNGGQIGVGC